MNSEALHVIVQAGGRGSRLRHHTWNKPKCLVSVRGKPILYHLFDTFDSAKFIIIGDYLFDQLEKYLLVNQPNVNYELIRSKGTGTASGISEALEMVPPDSPILLTWSDLLFKSKPTFPDTNVPSVMITDAFTCRWSATSTGRLEETTNATRGVPGVFYFPRAGQFTSPPADGEFVRWLVDSNLKFNVSSFHDLEELGDFSAIEIDNDRAGFCRFFNQVDIDDLKGIVTKQVKDLKYQEVHHNEINWYKEAARLNFKRMPSVLSTTPLTLEKIRGIHPYEAIDFSEREKRSALADVLDTLSELHSLDRCEVAEDDIRSVYIDKTQERVHSVSALLPMFNRDTITINGHKCQNVFAERHRGFWDSLPSALRADQLVPIHGDPTFSNTILDDKLRSWFIDPRGSFAQPGIFGDGDYDFAKVYYSAVGGYDAFNRKRFKLHVDCDTIEVLTEKPIFYDAGRSLFNDYFSKELPRIKLLHGLIWLSLSGYAKDDIDSVIGSFALGLYWLEDAMSMP